MYELMTTELLPEINSTSEVRVPLIRKFLFQGNLVSYAFVNAQNLLNATINSEMKKKLEPLQITDQDTDSVRTRKAVQIARTIDKFTVIRFEDENKVPVIGDIDQLLEQCHPQNLTKIMLVSAAHLKGTWLTKGKYICLKDGSHSGCATSFRADIDPRSPIPEDLEPDRIPMTDIRDFYVEKADVFKNGMYEYTYKVPIPIKTQDGDGYMTKVTLKTPTFQIYQKAMTEAKRLANSGLWIIHDSIININDWDEETTRKIVGLNSFDKLMSFQSIDDKDTLIEAVNNNGYFIFDDFHLNCKVCFTETELPFDATAHFLSLYR